MSNALLDALGIMNTGPTKEESEYMDALRYAVIDAAFAGDDDDARTVRAYVDLMKGIDAIMEDAYKSNTRVARPISDALTPFHTEGGKLLDAFMNLASVRLSALGIDLDEIRESVPKPDSLKENEMDTSPFPATPFMGPMGSAG